MLITKFIVDPFFRFFSNARSFLFFVFFGSLCWANFLVFSLYPHFFSNARLDNYHSRKFYSIVKYYIRSES